MASPALPQLSVVIVADDKESCLDEQVRGLVDGTPADIAFEVVYVAVRDVNPEDRRTRADSVAAGRTQVRHLREIGAGRARGRNLGIAASTAPVVVLLADDFRPLPGFLAAHLAHHVRHPETEAVGIGPNVFPARFRTPFAAWLEDTGRGFGVSFTTGRRGDLDRFFYGANTSIKRAFLDRIGPSNEAFPDPAVDDHELAIRAWRAGMRTTFLPEARTVHEHDVTFADRSAAMFRAGAGHALLEHLHPDQPPPSARYPASLLDQWCEVARTWWATLSGRPEDLQEWWAARLLLAEMRGWRAARARGFGGATGRSAD